MIWEVVLFSTILFSCVVGAQGDLCTMTIISYLLCIPILFLNIPDSFTSDLWQLPAETSGSEAGETW
jgi:hypothetical protein